MEVKPFNRLPTSSWKALIQARLYVAEYGGSFRLVMGEVFELSTNSSDPPLELRIDQKIFAIKLEMRYINEVIFKNLIFLKNLFKELSRNAFVQRWRFGSLCY